MKLDFTSLSGKILLAPMAGLTDRAYREIARGFGIALSYTEMISAKAICHGNKQTMEMLKIGEEEGPVALQLFGSEASSMKKASEIASDTAAVAIDINMGCPTPKIVKNGDGAALMKDLEQAKRIISAVLEGSFLPVTVKMRTGWDKEHKNAVELAKIAESLGVSAVAVHGRTREEFYAPPADWETIRAVKSAVKIPVIGNGDVTSPALAGELVQKTGCDLVMIGRAAWGNPFMLRDAQNFLDEKPVLSPPDLKELIQTAGLHLEKLAKYRGEKTAVLEFRKHMAKYLKGMKHGARLKNEANAITTLRGMDFFLRSLAGD